MRVIIFFLPIISIACAENVGLKADSTKRAKVTKQQNEASSDVNIGNDFDTSDQSDSLSPSDPNFDIGNDGDTYQAGNQVPRQPGPQEPVLPSHIQRSRLRVGINYEDVPNTDQDFNDGTLCIEGRYEVNFRTGTVRSLVDQNTNLYFRDGGFNLNTIEVKKYSLTSNQPTNVQTVYNFRGYQNSVSPTLKKPYLFRANDYISVAYNRSQANFAAIPLSMGGNKNQIKIEMDICRNYGN